MFTCSWALGPWPQKVLLPTLFGNQNVFCLLRAVDIDVCFLSALLCDEVITSTDPLGGRVEHLPFFKFHHIPFFLSFFIYFYYFLPSPRAEVYLPPSLPPSWPPAGKVTWPSNVLGAYFFLMSISASISGKMLVTFLSPFPYLESK